MVLIRDNQYLLENHVIYITHSEGEVLKGLYDYLNLNKNKVQDLLNSTNLTKTEIENLCIGGFKKNMS